MHRGVGQSHAMTYSHGMTKAVTDLNAIPDQTWTGRSYDADKFVGEKDLPTYNVLLPIGTGSDNVKVINKKAESL